MIVIKNSKLKITVNIMYLHFKVYMSILFYFFYAKEMMMV